MVKGYFPDEVAFRYIHCRKRAMERYGFGLSEITYSYMCWSVVTGEAEFIRKVGPDSYTFKVNVYGKVVNVVFSESLRIILTILNNSQIKKYRKSKNQKKVVGKRVPRSSGYSRKNFRCKRLHEDDCE